MNRYYIRYPGFLRKAVTLSYDDSVYQDIRLTELLNRYGLKCTFNVNGAGLTGEYRPDRKRLPADTARKIYKGHEVACHSYTHPYLEELPAGNDAWEIVKDREILEKTFGGIIRGMAYPMGTLSDSTVLTLRQCGILYARTTKSSHNFDLPADLLRLSPTCHHTDPKLLDLAGAYAELVPVRKSTLFYVWGHSYEFDDNNDWDRMEEFCRLISGREDCWYACNGEIIEYLEAGRQIISSVDGGRIFNPTCRKIWLSDAEDLTKIIIEPGESVEIGR